MKDIFVEPPTGGGPTPQPPFPSPPEEPAPEAEPTPTEPVPTEPVIRAPIEAGLPAMTVEVSVDAVVVVAVSLTATVYLSVILRGYRIILFKGRPKHLKVLHQQP